MTDGLVLFASAIGTMADGLVLFASAIGTMTDGPVLFDQSVFIDPPGFINRSVFIDRPGFIQVLWSRLDLDSAFDRRAIARIGPTGTGPTGPRYSAIPPL
jgi:hypothetical protein